MNKNLLIWLLALVSMASVSLAIYEKQRADQNDNHAEENERVAREVTESARKLQESAKAEAESAMQARRRAEVLVVECEKRASLARIEAQQNRMRAQKAEAEAAAQKNQAILNRLSAEKAIHDLHVLKQQSSQTK